MGREVSDLREDDEEGAMSAIECASLRLYGGEFVSAGYRLMILMDSIRHEHRSYGAECAE